MITRSQYKLFLTLKDKIVNLENKNTQTTCTIHDFNDEDQEWIPDTDEEDSESDEEDSESDEEDSESDEENESENTKKNKKKRSKKNDDDDDEEDEEDEEDDELIKEEINDIICAVIHNNAKPPKKRLKKEKDPSNFEYNLTYKEEQYYDSLSPEEKDNCKNMYKSLVLKSNTNEIPNKFKILSLNINENIKKIILQKCESLANMDPTHGEYHKLNKWVTNIMKIPFGKYIEMPVNSKSNI